MVLDKLRNATIPGASTPGFLRPIDTKRIARDVDLDARCADNGTNNIPASTATTLDGVEQDIVQRLESDWAAQGDVLLTHLQTYAKRLSACSVHSEFERLRVSGLDTLTKLRAAHTTAERELGPLREEYLLHRNDLEEFRTKHKLKRAVRDPGRRFTTYGILTILIALESILNGAFFADTASRGLVGGIGIAIGISFLNVLVAFSIGAGPARWLHHRNWAIKLVGLIMLATGATFIVGLHGLAFHLREASAVLSASDPLFTPQQALALAMNNIVSEPLALHDLNSFYLFALGIVFAFGAFLKGYRIDDPYPGYGAHFRRSRTAREDYSEAHEDLFDRLTEAKNHTVAAIDQGLDRIPRLPQEANSIRANRSSKLEQFSAYETEVEVAANQLLQHYRDCNRKSRTAPPPPHFEERWSLPYRFVGTPRVKELVAEVGDGGPDIPTALNTLRELLSEVLAEYEKLIGAHPHPTEMD